MLFTIALSDEVYRMEVDQVQNIRHVYILQVCHNRVFLVWSGEAVDDDVLLVVTYGKVIYLQMILAVCYF